MFSAFFGQPVFCAGISTDPIELLTPALGENSGYKLTEVAQAADNTITKYLLNSDGTITPKNYAVSLSTVEYGHKDKFDDVIYYKFDNTDGNLALTDASEGDFNLAYYVDSSRLAQADYYSGTVDNDFVNIKNLRIVTKNSLVSVTGDFIGNSQENAYGIGIINMQAGGYADNIVGNFINNALIGTQEWARGSILYLENGAKVGSLSGNFIGNSSISNFSTALGGVLFSAGSSVDAISGSLVANYVKGAHLTMGGALYISMSTVGTITGDFINNYALTDSSHAKGGAIHVQLSSEITSITGDFIGNAVKAYNSAAGGAIHSENYTKIKSITGDFIGNSASSSGSVQGGAIGLQNNSVISSVTGDFVNNIAKSETNYAYGGAVGANGSSYISKITGDFINNAAVAGKDAKGGALWVAGRPQELIGSFINNHAATTSTTELALGGAIFSITDLKIIADGKNLEFTGNYTEDSRGKIPNAIYVDIISTSSPTITLTAQNNGTITFNDQIDGGVASGGAINRSKQYNLALTGDSTGKININNEIINANITLDAVTLHLGQENLLEQSKSLTINSGTVNTINNAVNPITIPSITLNGNFNYALDVNLAAESADSLQITSTNTPSNIHITEINTIGDIPSGQTASIIPFLTGNYAQNITTTLADELSMIYGQSYAYHVGINNENLVFIQSEKITGLPGALSDNGDRTFIMQSDELITGWVSNTQNSMQGNKLVIQGNNNSINGNSNPGIIINPSQTLTIKDVKEISGFNSTSAGAILNNNAILNIIAENTDTIFQNNTANGESNAIHNINSTLNLNASSENKIIFNDKITSDSSSVLNINPDSQNGTIVINNDMSGFTGDVNLENGTLKLTENGTFFNAANFNVKNGTLDLANNMLQSVNFNNLSISNTLSMAVDADLAAGTMDTISAQNSIVDAVKIRVSSINLLSEATSPEITINFTDDSLKSAVSYTGADVAYSNIYKYSVKYDENTGDFTFTRYSPANSSGFNPSVLTGAVAQQGAFLTMLDVYDQAFNNFDMRMLIPRSKRHARKFKNMLASGSGMVYEEKHPQAWFRPYASFENVPLKNGPRVSSVQYGSLFGTESDIIPVKFGFERVLNAYAGYVGSHQAFQGQSIYQNGGTIGASAFFYKGNFFTGFTANTAGIQAEAATFSGRDNMTMLTAGIAAKTGYNKLLFKDKLILQPNAMMSYTFVNTFNYHSKSGVGMTSEALNAIQVVPGIKMIANLKNGWQPYLSVSMVFNIMDDTRFKANDVSLPQLAVKPYVLYGAGLQKQYGERFTCYIQTLLRSGGRNGIGFTAGLKWKI